MADPNSVAQYIWRRARELGVNPNMALGIARFEGLNPNTLGSPTYGNPDAKGYSFGPFQLYSGSSDPSKIAPGGMAYDFLQKYGKAPSRDNWQQQVDFSLETMKSRGVSPWHAVRDQGGVEAITQKGAKFANSLGLKDDGTYTPPQQHQATAPAAEKVAEPVYRNDIFTAARYYGNKLLPDQIDAPTPLTADEIKTQQADLAQSAGYAKAAGGLLNLAKLLQEKPQPEEDFQPMPMPERRRVAFRPLAPMRGLL